MKDLIDLVNNIFRGPIKRKKEFYDKMINHIISTISNRFKNGEYELTVNDNSRLGEREYLAFLNFRLNVQYRLSYNEFCSIRKEIYSHYTSTIKTDSIMCYLTDNDYDLPDINNCTDEFYVHTININIMVSTRNQLFIELAKDSKFRRKLNIAFSRGELYGLRGI